MSDSERSQWRKPDDHRQHGLEHLPDATYGVEVRFPPGMPDSIQRLMGVLGVRVVFDERVEGRYQAARARRRKEVKLTKPEH